MSFENVMGTLMQWITATEALAAVGAEITLRQSGADAPPEIVAALHAVSEAAGLGDLAELPPPQQAVALAQARIFLRQATDLLEDPARPAGWTFTDPVILDGWGRGSTLVPSMIAAGIPELGEVTTFLDVGTGVGLLAVTAASVWPAATIVGIDTWDPSLERARAHLAEAGLEGRITLRKQDVAEIDDEDQYNCIWVPTFFLTDAGLDEAVPRLFHAARPGGWLVLGRISPPPDPLAEAVGRLRTIRAGGVVVDGKRCVELLENAGCAATRTLPRTPGVPMEFVVGQKPA